MRYVLLILVLPLVEIGLFVGLGGALGVLGTLLEVVASAALGLFLLTQYSFLALLRNPAELARAQQKGESVVLALVGSALLAIAGVLLMVPGFFTDALGVALLVPPLREAVAARLMLRLTEQMTEQMKRQRAHRHQPPRHQPKSRKSNKSNKVIEGEYRAEPPPKD